MNLSPSSYAQLMNRCFSFYDSVIVDIKTSLRPKPRRITVLLEAKDNESSRGWSRVCFTLNSVTSFKFELARFDFEVLSSGLQVVWLNDELYVFFDAYPDDAPLLPNLNKNIAYVICKSCSVDIDSLTVAT